MELATNCKDCPILERSFWRTCIRIGPTLNANNIYLKIHGTLKNYDIQLREGSQKFQKKVPTIEEIPKE